MEAVALANRVGPVSAGSLRRRGHERLVCEPHSARAFTDVPAFLHRGKRSGEPRGAEFARAATFSISPRLPMASRSYPTGWRTDLGICVRGQCSSHLSCVAALAHRAITAERNLLFMASVMLRFVYQHSEKCWLQPFATFAALAKSDGRTTTRGGYLMVHAASDAPFRVLPVHCMNARGWVSLSSDTSSIRRTTFF